MADQKVTITISARDVATATFKKMSRTLKGVQDSVFSLKGAFVGLGGVLVARDFLTTAQSFETLGISLKTVTGSAEQAQAAMAWITDFTARTPYELQEVADGFRKLAAYGLDATKFMQPLGDTAAAMGKTLDQAVEMFADAAQGEFERLKEFGVRASQEGDKVTFTWTENGKQMVREAEKTQTGITTALGQIFERFKGGMEEQSRSWSGMVSNLMDRWTQFKLQVMESGPFRAMKAGLKGFLEYFETNKGKMDLAHWADTAARATITAFKSMTKATEWFIRGLRSIGAAYQWVKTNILEARAAVAEMVVEYRKLFGGDVEGSERIALRANIQAGQARSALERELISIQEMGKEFDRIQAFLDELNKAKPVRYSQPAAPAIKPSGTTEETAAKETKAQIKERERLLKQFDQEYRKATMSESEFAADQARRQAEAWEKAGADQAKVAQWLAEEVKEAEEKRLQASREASDGATRAFRDYASAATDAAANVERAVTNSFQGMEDAIVSFAQTGRFEFRSMADSIISDMIRMTVRQNITGPLAQFAGQALGSWLGGLSTSNITTSGSMGGVERGTARASGGPVDPYSTYLVGERGPELLTLGSRGGHVTPNHALGGSVQVIVNEAPAGTQVSQRSGPNGMRQIIVDLKQSMAQDVLAGGPLGRAIGQSFGLQRAGRPV